ncbi:LicD family protein [Ligilactobacillus agilis]|uniref:LicD family protein n=1 Tax=Ligilactobacillus agilis TaxID=1601 RepID=A0A9Q9J7S8_9LACO|nr:LicD family protein [Ligilactobacillus agilis]UXC62730.1 LicD family protein [Ligilactobacillus agilis]UXC64729.1 LicD family protein [Ligilactobacillus agilis]
MNEVSIEETQKISLEILNTISLICEEKNLRYALIYGTLIGAVRHQGYIPWDDDIDIMMPRPDYEKLLQYLKENIAVYPHLQVFNPDECADYPYMITRISDNRYVIDVDNEDPYGMGVFIDVYPYDGLGNSKKEALKFGLKGDRLSSLCYQATRRRFAIETTTSNVRKILKYPVYLYAKLRGKEVFQRKLAKLAGIKEYDESNYVGCVVWLSWGEKDIFPRKWFEETILVNFDKYKFRIPKEYDALLRYEYGDYMKLPPKKERVGHHNYKVYKK